MKSDPVGRPQARRATAGRALLLLALLGGAGATVDGVSAETGGQLFVRLQTERPDRFLQEEFDFTLTVYSRGLTLGREIALLNEETPGLRFHPFRDRGGGSEEHNARVYEVRRFVGRAQGVASGSFALRPTVRVQVVVPGRERGAARSSRAEIRQTELHAPPLTVRIQPLPEAGRPEGFTGAVGSFTLTAAARPAAVAVGEPVTLSLDLRGRGNIGSLAAPAVPAGAAFKAYEPRLLTRELGENGAEGRLVFEQVLVPRTTDAGAVPAVTFSYFDPERRSYQVLVRGPFPLSVKPSAQGGAPVAASTALAPVPVRPRLPAAIAPLKPEPGAWRELPVRFWHESPWLLVLQLVPPAVVAALFLAVRRRDERARDPGRARRRIAPSVARPGLAGAANALREGDAVRFHEALWGALSCYFGNRLDLRPGEVSGAAVAEGLAREGHDRRDIARLGAIFELLEQERFGRPSVAAGPLCEGERHRLAALLEEVDRLLQACEGDAA